MKKSVEGKNVLVTGGSGFLGEELIGFLVAQNPQKIRVIARNEGKLILLKQKYPSIEFHPGDLANPFDCEQAAQGMDCCFHLSAFKHVGMAEKFSIECTRSNVIGTINILESAARNNFEFIVGISTDKAAQVVGVYGATKYLMEKLFEQYERVNPGIDFRIVRYGNVLYSTGSVLCKWKSLLEKGEPVIVTDPKATRFFWTRTQAVELIFECLNQAQNTKPWVPEMKAMSIGNLLTAMSKKYLPENKSLQIKSIGLQPGENLHEKILEGGPYSNEVEQFTIEEIMELV